MSTFSLETFHGEGSVRIALEGELDSSVALVLDDELRRAEASARDVVVLDLSALRFMDSTGLGIIACAYRRMTRTGRRLVVASPTYAVKRILAITGMLRRLEVVEDRAVVPA